MTAAHDYGQAPHGCARSRTAPRLADNSGGYPSPVTDTPPPPEQPYASANDLREALAAAFQQTADVLERSAELADEDARRRALQGQDELAAIERQRAAQARAAAGKARINAQLMRNAPR